MGAVLKFEPKKRGRPKRKPFDRTLTLGWNSRPETAAAWFAVGEHIAMLRAQGYAAADIAEEMGVSPATVSRWVRGARWPAGIRARILIASQSAAVSGRKDPFPVKILMRLARTTFKDQGSQTAKDARKGPKSRLTLMGAVLAIIEGKSLPRVQDDARARADRLEKALVDERGRRHALTEECQRLKDDKRALDEQLSADVLSKALRRNHELESELQRLRLVPGAAPVRPKKSPDLERADELLQSALGCRVDTLDWSRGLLLIKAGNGDILDGVRERLLYRSGGR
jgi:hypothetical protein